MFLPTHEPSAALTHRKAMIKYLALALVLVAAPGAGGAPTTVTMRDDAFVPARLRVHAGDRVTFVNRDDDAHTVTSTTGSFDSKGLDTGDTWQHTFSKPGVYHYICQLHPFMKGAIIVVKAGTP